MLLIKFYNNYNYSNNYKFNMHKLSENFQIIKKIGSGMTGKVYEVEFNDKVKYALKIEKIANRILDIENINSTKIREWRDIEFSINFANQFQEQFVTLHDNDFVDNCDFQYSSGYRDRFDALPENIKKIYKEKEDGTYCSRKLYTLTDNTLYGVKNISLKQQYSVLTQMVYICYLLQSYGYVHGDIHFQNIGINYVDSAKQIEILNGKLLNTFGLHVKLIDFGRVLNIKYELDQEEELEYKYAIKNEINKYLSLLVKFEKNKQIYKLVSWTSNLEFFQNWIHGEEIKKVKDFATNDFDRYFVYQLIYPNEFQRAYFGNKYIKTYKFFTLVKLKDILFILKYKNDFEKIINYLIITTNNFKS